MDHGTADFAHRDYEDMLAPAALGVLSPEEHAALVAHLRTCTSCREMLGRLIATTDALPLSVEDRAPSDALRERLLAQVRSDPRAQLQPMSPRTIREPELRADEPVPLPLRLEPISEEPVALPEHRRRGGVLWALAIAATLLLGVLSGVLIDRLVLDGDEAGDVREIALQSPTGLELESARLEYLEDVGIVRFAAPDLPEPPAGRVYQVWLIEAQDAPPTPVGVIDPATGEFATSADLVRYTTFAVTVEPGPLGSPAPTTEPVIVAQLPDPASG